jgi:hypothetical protein
MTTAPIRTALVLATSVLVPAVAPAQTASTIFRPAAVQLPAPTERGIVRQARVRLVDGLTPRSLAESSVLDLALFPDVTLRVIRERTAPTRDGVTWTGRIENYPDGDALFVFDRGGLVGHVHTPFGFFRVEGDRQGAYLVQQIDPQPERPEPDDAVVPDDPAPSTAGRRPLAVDDGRGIDVMVAFTRAAVDGLGGEDRARTTAEMLVTETSRALVRTGIGTTMRLVHVQVVDYEESNDSSIDLTRLRTANDGFLDEIHKARDAYGADLAVLITEQMAEFCGRGYVNRPIDNGAFGFSVVKRACTSNGRTFAHEVGHNLGLNHDWYVTPSPGAFSYSKGHVSLEGRFLDLMAYYDLCTETKTSCTNLLHYTNPEMARNGYTTGVAQGTSTACVERTMPEVPCDADAAATLRRMVGVVARFRQSVTPDTPRVLFPEDAIASASGSYRLLYQQDGNLVLYDMVQRIPLWQSGTAGTRAGRAELQDNGNFVVLDAGGVLRWETRTTGNPGATLSLGNDGNLLVLAADGRVLWDRFR